MSSAQRKSRPVQVAEAIKSWMVEQRLQSGDRLPGEAELIARFGMAKGTIREAMRILEAQGLILTRTGPGGGSFVDAVSAERARSLLANYFYFEQLTVNDIYQVREVLEPELVGSLAGRLTESQLAELDAIVALYPSPARTADEERDQHVASLTFHARLADFAGNKLLGFMIGFMSQILSDLTVYRRLYGSPNEALWRAGRQHQCDLVAALRAGDAEGARRIMASHMAIAHRFMEEQEAEVAKRFIAE